MKQVDLPPEARMIADRLRLGMTPERVYLFGSHARGEAGPDSDLDFLVVVPDSPLSRFERAVHARQFIGDAPYPVDILVLTRREWEEEQQVVCSLPSTVLREGVCLHG